MTPMYRVSHLVIDVSSVDFDLSVPPFCPTAKPLLPSSHHLRQSWADSQQNLVYDQMAWDALC